MKKWRLKKVCCGGWKVSPWWSKVFPFFYKSKFYFWQWREEWDGWLIVVIKKVKRTAEDIRYWLKEKTGNNEDVPF